MKKHYIFLLFFNFLFCNASLLSLNKTFSLHPKQYPYFTIQIILKVAFWKAENNKNIIKILKENFNLLHKVLNEKYQSQTIKAIKDKFFETHTYNIQESNEWYSNYQNLRSHYHEVANHDSSLIKQKRLLIELREKKHEFVATITIPFKKKLIVFNNFLKEQQASNQNLSSDIKNILETLILFNETFIHEV